MTDKELKEYNAGFEAGKLHDITSALCNENIGKMKIGIQSYDRPLIQAYWLGYKGGLRVNPSLLGRIIEGM